MRSRFKVFGGGGIGDNRGKKVKGKKTFRHRGSPKSLYLGKERFGRINRVNEPVAAGDIRKEGT